MKLIDKDKLHLTYKQGTYIGHGMYDGEGYYVDGNEVANAPIIEAIPIEWTEEWVVKKYAGAGRIIDCLIEDWEKENES